MRAELRELYYCVYQCCPWLIIAIVGVFSCRGSRSLSPNLLGSARPARFVEKPHSAFRLIDPVFKHACRCDIAVFIAKLVDPPHLRGQLLIIAAQLGEHVLWIHIGCIVVQDTLLAPDMTNRPYRGPSDLARALGDGVRHGEDLIGLLIQQQMIIAKMAA